MNNKYRVKYIWKDGAAMYSDEFDTFEEAFECYVEILSTAIGLGEAWQKELYKSTLIEILPYIWKR